MEFHGVADRVPYGLALLKDAVSKGAVPLFPVDYPALANKHGITLETLKEFDKELRQVLEAKLGEPVWPFVTTTPEAHGLELWRKLSYQFNPHWERDHGQGH